MRRVIYTGNDSKTLSGVWDRNAYPLRWTFHRELGGERCSVWKTAVKVGVVVARQNSRNRIAEISLGTILKRRTDLAALAQGAQTVAAIAIGCACRANIAALALLLAGRCELAVAVGIFAIQNAALAQTAVPLASAGVAKLGDDELAEATTFAKVAVPTVAITIAAR